MGCACRKPNVTPTPEHKSPVMDDQGAVLFYDQPQKISGYTADPDNTLRLVPDQEPCAHVMSGVLFQTGGTFGVLSLCQHSNHPTHRGKQVTPEICAGCPLRELTSKKETN